MARPFVTTFVQIVPITIPPFRPFVVRRQKIRIFCPLNSVSVNFVRDSGQICFFKALQRTEFFYRKQYTENCRISKPLVRRNIVIKCYFSRFPSYTFGFHKLSSTYRLFFSLDGIIKLLLFNGRPALSVTNKLTSY